MNKHNIYLTQPAFNDLQNIHDYIAETIKAPQTAKKFVDKLFEKIDALSIHGASIGIYHNKSLQQSIAKDIRRINFRKWAIIYTIDGSDIFIERILFAAHIPFIAEY